MMLRRRSGTIPLRACALAALLAAGCGARDDEVVVYCALDREFSEPILERFERETGVRVRAKYDVESTKSVGLTEEILRERSRPRCDVFWNNEIANTLRLEQANLLAPSPVEEDQDFPASARDPEGRWHALAARLRVLLVHTELVPDVEAPACLEDLADPRWKGKVGMAKPLFGTTATQMAVLFSQLGPERAKALLGRLKANDVRILSGNKQVAVEVGAGRLAMGLTDTDDALAEIQGGRPVRMLPGAASPRGQPPLLIPNTVAIVRGAPHPENARRLVGYLLSPRVEDLLARGPSGQIPLGEKANARPALGIPLESLPPMADFETAAANWDRAAEFLKRTFAGP